MLRLLVTGSLISGCASKTVLRHCCAIDDSLRSCSFQESIPVDNEHGCATFTWLAGSVPTVEPDEYISLVEILNLTHNFVTIQSVSTEVKKTLQFSVQFPVQWTQFVDAENISPIKQVFSMRNGYTGVGFHMNPAGTPNWVEDLLGQPMNVGEIECSADGNFITCPVDPLFSHTDYQVVDAQGEACITRGSWGKPRTEVTIDLQACPPLDFAINSSVLSRKLRFQPLNSIWNPLHSGQDKNGENHSDIPSEFECECILRTGLTQSILIRDDGTLDEVSEYWAEAGNIRVEVTVDKTEGDNEGMVYYVINASTTLDNINIEEVIVDAAGTDGRALNQVLPIMKTFDDVSDVSTAWSRGRLGLSELKMDFLINYMKPTSVKRNGTGNYKAMQEIRMNGFTAMEGGFLFFNCTVSSCTDEYYENSRCSNPRRLQVTGRFLAADVEGRRLEDSGKQSGEENMKVSLTEKQTSGRPMPNSDDNITDPKSDDNITDPKSDDKITDPKSDGKITDPKLKTNNKTAAPATAAPATDAAVAGCAARVLVLLFLATFQSM